MNINKLNGKMAEAGMTKEKLARAIGLNPSTLYRKVREGANKLTVEEIGKIAVVLNLSASEARNIFLFENSQ